MKPLYTSLLLLAGTSLLGCADDAPPGGSTTQTPPTPAAFGPLGDRPDLPVDERISVEGLSAPVDVVRDRYGRPHVYAATLRDAMLVEGYLVARDRNVQLDLLRRAAEGRLAEVFGDLSPEIIDQDIVLRHVGLGRVAAAQYAALTDPETVGALDAYASGVTQVFRSIRAGEIPLPAGIASYPVEALEDWTGIDSLAVARYQSYLLSYSVDFELYHELFLDDAQSLFEPGSSDPQLARRAGLERDFWRMGPMEPEYTSSMAPGGASNIAAPQGAPGAARPVAARVKALGATMDALERVRMSIAPEGFGSNAWLVAPSRSATGHAMLANDPHLGLGSPATFWPFSFHVGTEGAGPHASGVAFPGIPGLILGHNQQIAWGATVAGYDVNDVYAEELSPDGQAVIFEGQAVPLETIEEVILIRGREPYTYRVRVVPHHGPIIPTITGHQVQDPDPAVGALSVRWTGHEPTLELEAVFALMSAATVDEARAALGRFRVGAQNWLVADTAGEILWTSHAAVPRRSPASLTWDPATYTGNIPCLVLPGDGSAEWEGYLDQDLVPWEKNPAAGFIVSANNDPMGVTGDGDPTNDTLADGTPLYLDCEFDPGVRAARIRSLLESATDPLSAEGMAQIQGDVRSWLGSRLVPFLVEAITRGEEERSSPGTHPDLTAIVNDMVYDPGRIAAIRAQLEAWGTEADFTAASGIDPETGAPLPEDGAAPEAIEARAARATLTFNAWMLRLLGRVFADEYTRMGRPDIYRSFQLEGIHHLLTSDPSAIATFDAATGESALWDDLQTPELESRHERALRALLDAISWMDTNATGDMSYWGAHHRVQLAPSNPLWTGMTIPPPGDPIFPDGFPRPGDLFAVDPGEFRAAYLPDKPLQFTFSSGAAQRFVVDLDPAGPRAINAIPGGAIWDPDSPHFRDEAELWSTNRARTIPFLLEDVVADKESRTVIFTP